MNLFLRALTAAVLLPVVITAIHVGDLYFLLLILLVGFLLADEIVSFGLGKSYAYRPAFWAPIAIVLVLLFLYPGSHAAIFAIWFFLFYFGAILTFLPTLSFEQIGRIGLVLVVLLYAFLGLASVIYLRQGVAGDSDIGRSFIYLALVCTFANDTFAYFVGRRFGKHPLLESVSQKKTWEGFFAGAAASVVMPFVLSKVFEVFGVDVFLGLGIRDILFVSIGIAFLGPLGDLMESRIKRAFDIKDSGTILPGHGGVFDRIDALLVTLPFTFAYAFFLRSL
jgi:phosphatidate cytidylyltransferase